MIDCLNATASSVARHLDLLSGGLASGQSIQQSRVTNRGSPPAPLAVVVDDDDDTRLIFRHLLELEGWLVLGAADGEEALRCVAASPPEVVITDIEMPVMNGLELARRLRAEGPAELRILAVTWHRLDDDAAALFDGVVRKPASVLAIRSWLRDG